MLGYFKMLGTMDPEDCELAHKLLEEAGIDHVARTQALCFKDDDDRREAVKHLIRVEPDKFSGQFLEVQRELSR